MEKTELWRKRIEQVNFQKEKEGEITAFLICPVRGHEIGETEELVDFLEKEMGIKIHWPPINTDQIDETGLRICQDNMKAIDGADLVLVVWDGKSQGCLFDLGIAFAMRKTIVPLEIPELTEGKSFQNMMMAWYERE